MKSRNKAISDVAMSQNPQQQQQRKQQQQGRKKGVGQTIKEIAKQAIPFILKDILPHLIPLIPFPTSGAYATPTASSGLGMPVSASAANGTVVSTTPQRIHTQSNGNMSVTHREYVKDVVHGNTTDSDFELLLFERINPGNANIFPWLSTIASRYESYVFRRLKFIYEPQCSTTSPGTVMLAIDFDVTDSPPIDKTALMSYKGAVRSPAWFACVFDSDPRDLRKQQTYYTSSTELNSNDSRLSDVGRLILAFASESGGYTAGELYVEYSIDFLTPQLESDVLSGAIQGNGAFAPPFSLFGTTPKTFGPMGLLLDEQPSVLTVLVPNPGFWQIELFVTFTASPPSPIVPFILTDSQNKIALNNSWDDSTVDFGVVYIAYVQAVTPDWSFEIAQAIVQFGHVNSYLLITPFNQASLELFFPASTSLVALRFEASKRRAERSKTISRPPPRTFAGPGRIVRAPERRFVDLSETFPEVQST